MVDKFKVIFKKWMQSIVEMLVFFPILLFAGIYIMPHNLIWIWIGFISIYYLIGLLVGQLFKKTRMIILILIGMIISGLGVYVLFDGIVCRILSGILGTAVFVRGVILRAKQWEKLFPPVGLWGGLVGYFIGYFFFNRLAVLKPFSMIFNCIGIIYIVLMPFIINFILLKTASLPGDKEPVLPGIIKNHNRLLITVMLMVIGIISFFENLRAGVEWLVNGIGNIILKFIVFITNLVTFAERKSINSGLEGIQDLLPSVGQKSPSIFDKIVDKIIEFIGIVLFIAAGLVIIGLIGLALFILIKKTAAWLSRVYQLGKDMEDYGGYIDEKESLIDFRKFRKDYSYRFRRWITEFMKKEPKWDELKTNKERIRYIYRHFLISCIEKGYSFKEYLTPAETGEELSKLNPEKSNAVKELTEVYDYVRYGDKEIDDKKMGNIIQIFLKE